MRTNRAPIGLGDPPRGRPMMSHPLAQMASFGSGLLVGRMLALMINEKVEAWVGDTSGPADAAAPAAAPTLGPDQAPAEPSTDLEHGSHLEQDPDIDQWTREVVREVLLGLRRTRDAMASTAPAVEYWEGDLDDNIQAAGYVRDFFPEVFDDWYARSYDALDRPIPPQASAEEPATW